MAIITSNVGLIWNGLTTSDCDNIELANYLSTINSVLVVEPSKSGLRTKSPLSCSIS